MILDGKVAVITGASMGIGEAIAKLFVQQGAGVVLSSRALERAEAARQRAGPSERTMALACDVRDRKQVEALMAATLQRFGRCDIWVNNAGHGFLDAVERMDMAACRELFETNFFGMVEGLQVAAAVMRRQRSGTIINISSVAGYLPLPYAAAYSATKFAMNAIGEGARMELRHSGVHVMTVCPGFVATSFSRNTVRGSTAVRRAHEGKLSGIGAERVARAVFSGYRRHKKEVVVPWSYHIFIRLYQLWPSLVEYGMVRFMRASEQGQGPF
jgi:short-subunit dehydrogenase